ncbi:hypothetical protein EBZ37_12390, partial [bacterium]|nr:hypothetical protein [bacterium]
RRSLVPAEKSQDLSKTRLVEAVRIRRDSGAVQEVAHLRVPAGLLARARRLRPFEGLSDFVLEAEGEKVRLALRSRPSGGQSWKVQKNSEFQELAVGKPIELSPRDWIRMEYGPDDLYFRWVAPVAAVKVQREVIGNPVLRWGTVFGTGLALLTGVWIAWKAQRPQEAVVVQPPRIATIQVKEAPPPPPPVEKMSESRPDNVEKGKASDEKASKGGSEAAAPKFAKSPAPKQKDQAGLNAPVKPTDVNQVGLLGALKSSAPKQGPGVKADQIFNDGIVTQSVSGNTGSLTLKTVPSGALSVEGNSGAPRSKGNGLQALSTTLGGGDRYAPTEVGQVGRAGANGKGLGGGLGGGSGAGLDGIGGSDEGLGADVQGGLDRETVRRVIQSYRGKIRACYERAQISKPKLAGRVVPQFEISPKGPVVSASVKASTAGSPVLESCLLDVIREMQFPMAASGMSTRV